MVRNYKILFFIMLLAWLLLNLIQANYTEVISDEAYYRLYGRYLDWGYFDHPPMVALMTKISSLFFSGNLGIRFVTVLMQPLTLIFIWRTIDDNNPDGDKVCSFFIIAGSICMFAAYGFYTAPDVPLLFFTAFFLWSYQRYLKSQAWKNILFLSVSMAGLMYSKYQAFLVIGLIVLSNVRLLKSYRFWLGGVFALILLSPHIWWQFANDFPSFKFHLIERSEGFRWHHILEYIPNQMAVYNPLVLGAVFYIMIRNRSEDLFTRALYFLIIGFTGFFWLTAVRGHVEPHWTISCCAAMIILIYNNSTVNPKMFRFIRKALLPIILIILTVRILLVMDLPLVRYLGFNGKEAKYEFIESVAQDLPVVFKGSYQGPSLYSFFTGKEGVCINSLYSRKTEFDIWQFEKQYNNKPVFICGKVDGISRLYEKDGISFYGYHTDSLQTVNRIEVKIIPRVELVYAGDSLSLTMILTNPYPYDIDFNHSRFPVRVCMAIMKGEKINLVPVILKEPVRIMKKGEQISRTFKALVPELPAGSYSFGISLQTNLGPAINGSFHEIKIAKR